jgi:hypothetical protein
LLTLGGIGVYEEYEKFRIGTEAAGTGLSSKEPSPVWLVLSIAGVLFDATAVAGAVRTLRPAAQALEAGGSVAEFRQAVALLEKQGQIEARVARSVETAADARQAYGVAKAELRAALLGKAYSIPGPLADPEVYRAVVSMAAAKIRQGIESVQQFVLELNAVRVEAKLSELTGEELALAKQAFADARVQVARGPGAPTGGATSPGAPAGPAGGSALPAESIPAAGPAPAVAAGPAHATGAVPVATGEAGAFAQAVAQREAAVSAAEAEIAMLRSERSAALAKQAAERDTLLQQARAQSAETTRLERRALATKDAAERAEIEAQAAAARERWEAARAAQAENQDAVDAASISIRQAESRLEAAKTSLQLAQKGFRLQDVPSITSRLQSHVDSAAAKVDNAIAEFQATGKIDPLTLNPGDMGKVTRAAKAGDRATALAQARGNAIDKLAKEGMATDKDLAGLVLTPRGRKGPDIILDISQPGQPPLRRWWDVTTPEGWETHAKYVDVYGEGIPLLTRPPTATP